MTQQQAIINSNAHSYGTDALEHAGARGPEAGLAVRT